MNDSEDRRQRIESELGDIRNSLAKIEKQQKTFAVTCYVYFTILIIFVLFA